MRSWPSPAPAIRLGVLLLPCLLVVGWCGCRKTVTATSPLQGGRQLVSSRNHFSIAYPPNWHVREEEGTAGPVTALVSPQDSPNDEFAETVSITVDALQPGTSLEAFSRTKIGELRDYDGFDLLEEKAFLGKMPGKSVTFNYTVNGVAMRAVAHFFAHGGKGYALAGVATPGAFPRYESTFHEIAASFAATL